MKDFIDGLLHSIYVTFIMEDRYMFFVNGLLITLLLTFSSFIFGTLLGIIFCAMSKSQNRVINKIGNVITHILIEMPTMVLLMIMVYIIFGYSSISVVIIVIVGLTFKAGAYLSEIFMTALSTVQSGEIEAARTLGMNKYQAFFYVALPQTIQVAMPLYMNQFILTMQETSVVGYLAIVDLTKAASIVSSRTMDAFFGTIVITLIYFLIGYLAKLFFRHLSGKLNRNEVAA